MATPEGKVKNQTVKCIKNDFPTAWHYKPPGGAYGKRGVPDHVLCVPYIVKESDVGQVLGLFVSIEDKAEGKDPTPAQTLQHVKIREAGGIVGVVRGVEAVKRFFELLVKRLK